METVRYLAHVLGYYDFIQAPQVFAHAGEKYNLDAVVFHEQAHQSLTERSTAGVLLRIKAEEFRVAGPHDTLREWTVSAIARELKLVQEGLASYAEYFVLVPPMTHEAFITELGNRPDPVYHDGFALASHINRILAEEVMPEFTGPQLRALRYMALLDISRFALNIPIMRTEDDVDLVNSVRRNSPNERWASVLTSLACDEKARTKFVTQGKPLFTAWIKKSVTRFDGDTYSSISYADNIEALLHELYPELPYQPPWEAWFVEVGRKGPELVEEYVLREWTAELALHPRTKLLVGKISAAQLGYGLSKLSTVPGGATYMRICPSFGPSERLVSVGFDLPLRPGTAAVFLHEARLSFDANGGVWWNYQGEGFVTVVPLEELHQVLHHAAWRDAVVVVDISLHDQDPLRVMEWASVKAPLFVKTSPTGSVAAIAQTLSDPRVNRGANLVFMANWTHFKGAGSDQVFMVWTLSDAEARAPIVHFTSEPALEHVQIWVSRSAPKLTIVEGKERIDLPPRGEDGTTWSITESAVIHAPVHADTATAHLLSFGW